MLVISYDLYDDFATLSVLRIFQRAYNLYFIKEPRLRQLHRQQLLQQQKDRLHHNLMAVSCFPERKLVSGFSGEILMKFYFVLVKLFFKRVKRIGTSK